MKLVSNFVQNLNFRFEKSKNSKGFTGSKTRILIKIPKLKNRKGSIGSKTRVRKSKTRKGSIGSKTRVLMKIQKNAKNSPKDLSVAKLEYSIAIISKSQFCVWKQRIRLSV